jgi:hypothetical protein
MRSGHRRLKAAVLIGMLLAGGQKLMRWWLTSWRGARARSCSC